MYEPYFQLSERPFAAAPIAKRYFPATAIEQAHKTLLRCIERAEGAGLIVGPSGTGKSLLCQVLAQDLRGRFTTAVLASGQVGTRRALLQAILFELGLPYRGMDDGELRLMLLDHLSPVKQANEGLVLIVDEAHTLALRLLDELRMISNLVRDGQPRVRVVLCGSPQLEERLASPKMESLSQRLTARCYLEPLNRAETAAYIRAQITHAGGNPAMVFSDDALEAVHRATDGVPRLINQVCDHAMILASLGHCRPVNAAVIEEAWADLQQLPAPWNLGETKVAANSVVEFGGLDEESEIGFDAIPFRGPTQTRGSIAQAEKQLDELEAHLAELEEDFRPAGSIGPEVELVFAGARDPFGEHFEEEEVVLDRYSSLESDLFHNRPVVSSREGHELSALLAPLVTEPAKPVISMTISSLIMPTIEAEPAPEAASQTIRPPMNATPHVPETAVDDEDLIIVEEDTPSHLPPVQAPVLVRRQEYRQLFANLRRG